MEVCVDDVSPNDPLLKLPSEVQENGGSHPNGEMPVLLNSLNSLPTLPEGKRARFNIEKVDLDHKLSSPSNEHGSQQNTICDLETIGYATHEAVPLTVYYRNEASVPGKKKNRPTLDELHKGYDELDEQDVSVFMISHNS